MKKDEYLTDNMGFMECDTCSQKPGSTQLCRPCLNNRARIHNLSDKIEYLDQRYKDSRKTIITAIILYVLAVICGLMFK